MVERHVTSAIRGECLASSRHKGGFDPVNVPPGSAHG